MLDQRLVDTIGRTFNLDPSRVTVDTSYENTPGWDSVGHLNLILELEDVFGIRFSSDEIPTLNSTARLQESITRHGG
jgi:acyl carrier protein